MKMNDATLINRYNYTLMVVLSSCKQKVVEVFLGKRSPMSKTSVMTSFVKNCNVPQTTTSKMHT